MIAIRWPYIGVVPAVIVCALTTVAGCALVACAAPKLTIDRDCGLRLTGVRTGEVITLEGSRDLVTWGVVTQFVMPQYPVTMTWETNATNNGSTSAFWRVRVSTNGVPN